VSLLLVRTFSASLGCIHYGFFAIYAPREAKRQVKANFLGVMKISLIGKMLTRDGLNNFRENSGREKEVIINPELNLIRGI